VVGGAARLEVQGRGVRGGTLTNAGSSSMPFSQSRRHSSNACRPFRRPPSGQESGAVVEWVRVWV
jgi:hypothetical protein